MKGQPEFVRTVVINGVSQPIITRILAIDEGVDSWEVILETHQLSGEWDRFKCSMNKADTASGLDEFEAWLFSQFGAPLGSN